MKNRLINLALSFALKDIAAILRFIGTLEAKLEAYLDNQQREIDALDDYILDLATERAALAGDLSLAKNVKSGIATLRG